MIEIDGKFTAKSRHRFHLHERIGSLARHVFNSALAGITEDKFDPLGAD